MTIELATIQDVPALLDLQRKAFGPRLPHNRAWLCTCQQVRPPYEFYMCEGFKPYKSEEVGPGLTWAYLEK